MPRKKLTHPFQLELLQKQEDKARIEGELKLRQHIYKSAKESNKERKRRFAYLIAEKRLAAERYYQQQLVESGELDSDSNFDDEAEENDPPTAQEYITAPFDFQTLYLGILIGITISLCFSLLLLGQEHSHFFTFPRN